MANAKIVDVSTLSENVQAAIRRIATNHARINELNKAQDEDKAALKELCDNLFNDGIRGSEAPDLPSSYEFHVNDHVVRVVLKLRATPLTTFKAQGADIPAKTVIEAVFNSNTSKLFDEIITIRVTADQDTLKNQFTEHPDLVGVGLKALTHEQLQQLASEHPDWVDYRVLNPQGYSEVYPNHVIKESSMQIKNGFLEKASKVEKDILKKGRAIIKKIVDKTLNLSVTVGNVTKG